MRANQRITVAYRAPQLCQRGCLRSQVLLTENQVAAVFRPPLLNYDRLVRSEIFLIGPLKPYKKNRKDAEH